MSSAFTIQYASPVSKSTSSLWSDIHSPAITAADGDPTPRRGIRIYTKCRYSRIASPAVTSQVAEIEPKECRSTAGGGLETCDAAVIGVGDIGCVREIIEVGAIDGDAVDGCELVVWATGGVVGRRRLDLGLGDGCSQGSGGGGNDG